MKRLRILFIRWRKHRNRIDRLQRALDRCWSKYGGGRHYRKIIKLI